MLEILSGLSPGWFSWDHSLPDHYLPSIERDLVPRRLLQKTLVSCALTCRAISDLALLELWKVLDHHVFLLKLLPWTAGEDELFDEVIVRVFSQLLKGHSADVEQDLVPNVDEQAWSRFRWYARLVREMKVIVHTNTQLVHRNTWSLLASRLEGDPLLPSLRRLQMPVDMEDIVPFLFCLSPTIRTFALEFASGFMRPTAQERDFLLPFLTLISDPSGHPLEPSISSLIIGESGGEEIIQHLRVSDRLPMLEELDLTKIEYRIDYLSMAALSRLPSLCTLKTGLLISDPFAIPWLPLLTFSDFASLRHLSLSTLPLTLLSAVLPTSGLRASPIRSISLESAVRNQDDTYEPLPVDEFQHHLARICRALPDALEALQLWFTYSTRTEPPKPLSTLFAPFLSLGHLKSFNLSFIRGYVPHVSDDDLRALAAAWPHLEVLRIWVREMPARKFTSACPPTVAGLVELARGCSRLRQVMLPALDVSALPEASALPGEGHRGVWFLDISALVNDEEVAVEDVARTLDKVFPCVEEYFRIGDDVLQGQSWREVQGTMREIQATRRRGVGRE